MKVKYVLGVILSILAGYMVYSVSSTKATRVFVSSLNDRFSQHHVARNSKAYFYCDGGLLFKQIEDRQLQLMSEIDEVTALAANEEYLFMAINKKLIKLDMDGNACGELDLDLAIKQLYIDEKYLYAADQDYITLVDYKTMKTINKEETLNEGVFIEILGDQYEVQQLGLVYLIGGYMRRVDNTYNKVYETLIDVNTQNLLIDSNRIFGSIIGYVNQVFYFERGHELLEVNTRSPQNTSMLLSYNLDEEYKENNAVIKDHQLIFIGQCYNNHVPMLKVLSYRLFTGRPIIDKGRGAQGNIDKELMYHSYDTLYIYDIEKKVLGHVYQTRAGERILYANDTQAITYYDKTLNWYQLEDWTLQKQEQADYIENQGSYYFELCGNKIFVYNEQDKLLNIIKV